MSIKKIMAAVTAAAMACTFAGCSTSNTSSENSSDAANSATSDSNAATSDAATSDAATNEGTGPVDGKTYKIGVSKMMDHPALNKSEEGFVAALKDKGYEEGVNVEYDFQNGQGETSNLNTIATQFVGNNVDLIFAIATPAAQACLGQTQTIPIIGTAITDFADAGLVNSNDNPGTNVSGTTDMNPIEEQIDLMLELFPETKTVGFLYSSSEDNSVLQVGIARDYIESKGLATVEKTIINTNDIQQATTSIVSECDAIYIPTDNNFASAMTMVGEICNEAKIPVFCGESGMVQTGGLGTLGINYYDLGYQAGLMAVKVLEGADISTMAIEKSTNYEYCFNAAAVEACGITLPEKYAEYVYDASASTAEASTADAA